MILDEIAAKTKERVAEQKKSCLLYTSDAADE